MRIADHPRASEPYIRVSRRTFWRLLGALALLLILLFATHSLWLTAAAKVLILNQPLQKADAILVLGGGAGEREEWGAQLYSDGYAPRLITSGEPPHVPGEERSFAEISATWLGELGVPSEAISQMPKTTSTYEEALTSLALMQSWGAHTLIVVTDPYHTRRASWTFHDVYKGTGITVILTGTPYTWFSVNRWWTRERDLISVVEEYEKGIFYLLKGRLF